jgi:hypothetical protein
VFHGQAPNLEGKFGYLFGMKPVRRCMVLV